MSKIHIFGIKCWYLNSTVIATQLDNQGKKYYPILKYFLSDRSTKKDKNQPLKQSTQLRISRLVGDNIEIYPTNDLLRITEIERKK